MYKNTLRHLINQAKKLYFSRQFIKQRGNGKKTWLTIDNKLHRKPHKSPPDGNTIITREKLYWIATMINANRI